MRCSCCVLLYVTKLKGGAGKRTRGSSIPSTPRVGCVLGARTPHEFFKVIIRLDSCKERLLRNRKTGPGWISDWRMGAFFPKTSTYRVYNYSRFYFFPVVLSRPFLSLNFRSDISIKLDFSVDSWYCSLYILDVMYVSVRYSGYCWYWEYCGTLLLWCPELILRVLGVSPVLNTQILRVLGIWWAVYRTPSIQALQHPPHKTSEILTLQ